jgi:hypothetical protein
VFVFDKSILSSNVRPWEMCASWKGNTLKNLAKHTLYTGRIIKTVTHIRPQHGQARRQAPHDIASQALVSWRNVSPLRRCIKRWPGLLHRLLHRGRETSGRRQGQGLVLEQRKCHRKARAKRGHARARDGKARLDEGYERGRAQIGLWDLPSAACGAFGKRWSQWSVRRTIGRSCAP